MAETVLPMIRTEGIFGSIQSTHQRQDESDSIAEMSMNKIKRELIEESISPLVWKHLHQRLAEYYKSIGYEPIIKKKRIKRGEWIR